MTPEAAIRRLTELQAQIIHGKPIFSEIVAVIINSEQVRRAALNRVRRAIDDAGEAGISSELDDAHRILATNHPDGELDMSALNQQSP